MRVEIAGSPHTFKFRRGCPPIGDAEQALPRDIQVRTMHVEVVSDRGIVYGVAQLNPIDHPFRKDFGRRLALKRVLGHLQATPSERALVWIAYRKCFGKRMPLWEVTWGQVSKRVRATPEWIEGYQAGMGALTHSLETLCKLAQAPVEVKRVVGRP